MSKNERIIPIYRLHIYKSFNVQSIDIVHHKLNFIYRQKHVQTFFSVKEEYNQTKHCSKPI